MVRGPLGEPVPAELLRVGDTAYVESAQACGIHLTGGRDAERATTYGVGELVVAARESGVRTVVVGLGGSGTNDGGAGLLAALGATGDRPLDEGVAGLAGIARLDLPAPGVEIVAASDVDNPLTGLLGATKTFGPQKGIPEERLPAVDGLLEELARAPGRGPRSRREPVPPGGSATRCCCWDRRQSGLELVAEATDLAARARKSDLVVTGEGAFDFSSRAGKVPYGVASVAAEAIRPCVALAGQVLVGSREMRALGIESAYSLVDLVGEERAFAEPAEALAGLAARVARSWSH